jgi:hypothetical protein
LSRSTSKVVGKSGKSYIDGWVMILNSLELNTTYQSNAAAEELVSALTQEIEAQAEITKREKNLPNNRLALGTTYLRILEAGGHLGC